MVCKRICLYFLMVTLLVSTCVINVDAAGDSGTEQYIPQVDQHREDWKLLGIDGKTTLFVGDSYFTVGFWKNFYKDYHGKDAMIAGVGGTTARDWEYFLDYYLRYTCPKNIVVNLGINDIHNDHESADTVTENLQNLFTNMHEEDNLKDAKIYYFGIPYKKSTIYGEGNIHPESVKTTIDTVNTNMENWCKDKDWITYLGDLTGGAVADSQFRDNTHLTSGAYSIFVDALENSDISIEDYQTEWEEETSDSTDGALQTIDVKTIIICGVSLIAVIVGIVVCVIKRKKQSKVTSE